MKLYDNDLDADAYPVRLLLSMLRLDCERVVIDSSPLALRGLGPRGPVLQDGVRVTGAAAVLRHLAARHGPAWLPDPGGPGDSLITGLTSHRYAPRQARLLALFTSEGPPGGLLEEAARRLEELDDLLTMGELDGQQWLGGERPTIVDLAAFPPAALSNDYGVEQDVFPALRRWIRRVRALPGFVLMPGVPQFY